MMEGAFCGLAALEWLGWSYGTSMAAALAVMAGAGWLLERVVIRPILGQPVFSVVMLTFGIGYVVRGLITMVPNVGTETLSFAAPYKDTVFQFGSLVLGAAQTVVVIATAMLCALLYLIFNRSQVGIAMQAASQNQLAAYYMGIPVKRLNGLVWALAASVATLAGLMLAPITFVHANMGLIGLKAFPAAVVGGFTSLPGAILGGVIIGVVEALAGFYLPEGFKDVAAYIVVLLMLAIKPNGLLGENLRKKV
jgi:branched-chain amino acid transport system permease protein